MCTIPRSRRGPATEPGRRALRVRPAPTVVALLALAGVPSLGNVARAQSDSTREQIAERAREERGLGFAFDQPIPAIRVRANQATYTGAEFDGKDLHWFGGQLIVDAGGPIGRRGLDVGVSASTALVVPVVDGSTNLLVAPGSTNDPFDEFLDSSLQLGARLRVGKSFSFAATSGVSARHEIGVTIRDAILVGGSLSGEYRRADWLRLRLGLGLGTGLDDDEVSVSPVFRLRLRLQPGLWLETDATRGRLEWDATSKTQLSLFGGLDNRRYRLSRRGPVVRKGSLKIRKSEVGLGFVHRFGRRLRLRGEAAVVLGQHLSLRNEDGDTVDSADTNEPSAAFRLTVDWRPGRLRGPRTLRGGAARKE